MHLIGIDVGGTKIEAALLSSDGGYLGRKRLATPGDYDSILKALVEVVATVEKETPDLRRKAIGVGVCAPGSISPTTGVIRNANVTALNGRNFGRDLEIALGRPVRLSNDANCLALSEAIDGAASGARSVLAIILGTGCGAGLVHDGQLITGANGLAGEIGHISLPWPRAGEVPGPPCWCGQIGCVETWISGTGLRRDMLAATGRDIPAQDIVALMQAGDAESAAAFERLLSRIGRTIAALINIYDPDTFVLGGGLSNVDELYARLPDFVDPYVFADAWRTPIVRARWGDASGVRGAAFLWRPPTDGTATGAGMATKRASA